MNVDTSSIDLSTPESKATTLRETAANHRRDAARLEAEATEFRARAAALDDMPGRGEDAENNRNRAREADDDAARRRGTARAFDERADDFHGQRASATVLPS